MKTLPRVGRYVMFTTTVTVFLDPKSQDSCITSGWRKDGFLTITIGGAGDWPRVVSGALHEVVELAFMLKHCRLLPADARPSNGADSFLFVAKHHEFTTILDHAGDVLTYLLPALSTVWKQSRTRKTKKCKKKKRPSPRS